METKIIGAAAARSSTIELVIGFAALAIIIVGFSIYRSAAAAVRFGIYRLGANCPNRQGSSTDAWIAWPARCHSENYSGHSD